jgi:hypothetical protein
MRIIPDTRRGPCPYTRGEYSCGGAGYIWDFGEETTDGQMFPCPHCNTLAYLQEAKETAEMVPAGWNAGIPYTGVSLWMAALEHAMQWNPIQAKAALRDIGRVDALYAIGHGYRVRSIVYERV